LIAALMEEHRAIEAALDSLPLLKELLVAHYRNEEEFLKQLAVHEPAMAAKLRSQHEEALEIAGHLEDPQDADADYLRKRLVAIVQHNIIEEERDVFPRWGFARVEY
jgi:hypothetical protein